MMYSFVLSIVDFKFTNYKQTRNILSKKRKKSIGCSKIFKIFLDVYGLSGEKEYF